jgi:DNA-binding MarR family transcriptional regulator
MPTEDPDEDVLDEVGPAMSRLHRMWGRTAMAHLQPMPPLTSRRDLSRSRLIEHIATAAGDEIGVGAVGELLDVDASVASRMVADAIKAGYLCRVPSQLDGRRTNLSITEPGWELLREFRRHQRALYKRVTADWPAADRHAFARLFISYVDSMDKTRKKEN